MQTSDWAVFRVPINIPYNMPFDDFDENIFFFKLHHTESKDWLLWKSSFMLRIDCLQIILPLREKKKKCFRSLLHNAWPLTSPTNTGAAEKYWLTPLQTLNQRATLESHFLIVWAIRGGDHSKRTWCRVDTRVIREEGWVESEEGKEQRANPSREQQNDWNLNNHIKPAASHSLD